jgi:hypothetical protein
MSSLSPAPGDVPMNVSEPPLGLGHDHSIRHSVPDPPTESWRSKFTPETFLASVTSIRVIISPGPRGGSPAASQPCDCCTLLQRWLALQNSVVSCSVKLFGTARPCSHTRLFVKSTRSATTATPSTLPSTWILLSNTETRVSVSGIRGWSGTDMTETLASRFTTRPFVLKGHRSRP